MKYPNLAAFVGYEGDNVWIEPANERADDDPLVTGWPDLFGDEDPVRALPALVLPDRGVKTDDKPVAEPVKGRGKS